MFLEYANFSFVFFIKNYLQKHFSWSFIISHCTPARQSAPINIIYAANPHKRPMVYRIKQLVMVTHELLNFSLSPHLKVVTEPNGYFGHKIYKIYYMKTIWDIDFVF